jgi:hypothetical protein
MKVISYIATLPQKVVSNPDRDSAKFDTLSKFIQGVNASGDQGQVKFEMAYEPCDVAVMLGWVHEGSKDAPHLKFRAEVLRRQKENGCRTIIADSNLFLYKDNTNPHYYLRYSYDDVFPDSGEYCDQLPSGWRWADIQRDMHVDVKPWRTTGDHILLCLQRNGGWSMGQQTVASWATNTISQLRQHTPNRPIMLRGHPGDKKANDYMKNIINFCQLKRLGFVRASTNSDLLQDLENCWAVVNHNSSPAAAAILEGIPAFVTDPARSQSREVANHNLTNIENPIMPDRKKWAWRISQSHWSHADLVSGRCWQHMRKWAKK